MIKRVSVAAAKTHLAFVWQTYGRVQEGIVKKCTTVCSLDYIEFPIGICFTNKSLRFLVPSSLGRLPPTLAI
jgi:hypothetical protein